MADWTNDKPNYDLPWADNMYLAYPSQDKPNWSEFVAHVKQLNIDARGNTRYKIVYIMRRAHKASGDTTPDPSLDSTGVEECAKLEKDFKHAIENVGIPHPEVIASSPLARALETTQQSVIALAPTVSPTVLEGLRENLNGKRKNERHDKHWIQQNFTGFQIENVDANDSLGSQYAESVEPYELLWQRVKDSFAYIFENFPDALVVALMSHCYVIQTIQREISGFDLKEEERKDKAEFRLGDAGVYAIVVKGELFSS